MSTTALIVMAVAFYVVFAVSNSQAGGRIDASLSSVIFNGLGALLPLALYLATPRRAPRTARPDATLGPCVLCRGRRRRRRLLRRFDHDLRARRLPLLRLPHRLRGSGRAHRGGRLAGAPRGVLARCTRSASWPSSAASSSSPCRPSSFGRRRGRAALQEAADQASRARDGDDRQRDAGELGAAGRSRKTTSPRITAKVANCAIRTEATATEPTVSAVDERRKAEGFESARSSTAGRGAWRGTRTPRRSAAAGRGPGDDARDRHGTSPGR